MRWEIEPSGCCERKGMRQIRLCFYLEPGDARYAKHHVQQPTIPVEGYPGEKDEHGKPKSDGAFRAWFNSLPQTWQNNPFHNHIMQMPLDVTEGEIAVRADALLSHFYEGWRRREILRLPDGPY